MRTSTGWVLTLTVLAAGVSCAASEGSSFRQQLLPDPSAAGGRGERTYIHVPYESAEYVDGKIRPTWSEDYEVVGVLISADWKFVSDYAPGLEIPLHVDPGTLRYDFVGRFIDRRSGEEFAGLTPIFCRDAIDGIAAAGGSPGVADLAPLEGCEDDIVVLGCTVTDIAEECNVSVTCDGDSGTCSSCGDADTACCKSTTTTTIVSPTGVVTTKVVNVEKKVDCPKDPDKDKPGPPTIP